MRAQYPPPQPPELPRKSCPIPKALTGGKGPCTQKYRQALPFLFPVQRCTLTEELVEAGKNSSAYTGSFYLDECHQATAKVAHDELQAFRTEWAIRWSGWSASRRKVATNI